MVLFARSIKPLEKVVKSHPMTTVRRRYLRVTHPFDPLAGSEPYATEPPDRSSASQRHRRADNDNNLGDAPEGTKGIMVERYDEFGRASILRTA